MDNFKAAYEKINRTIENVETVIVGKRKAVEQVLIAVIAGGHTLIEDKPGLGKTTLAKSLARAVGCDFKRIQFTPDLLPSDITGVSIYNQKTGKFEFKPGPIFANIVVADEINRTTPRTQAALLEAMNESQVTIDNHTHRLPEPFYVMATLNPYEREGAFRLPDSQLDRFAMRISMGYPETEHEIEIMKSRLKGDPYDEITPNANEADIKALQKTALDVRIDESILRYILKIVDRTRNHPALLLGVSPRGTLILSRTARARALVNGRDYTTPDDIKRMAVPALAHRIFLKRADRQMTQNEIIGEILDEIPVPV